MLLLFKEKSVVVSHIQRIGCQPEKTTVLYTVANPARGLLNREKRTKEKVWQHTPPPPTPHTARSEIINKKYCDAVCAFCSARETCPTGPSSVGGSGRELSAEQADNLHEPCLS